MALAITKSRRRTTEITQFGRYAYKASKNETEHEDALVVLSITMSYYVILCHSSIIKFENVI